MGVFRLLSFGVFLLASACATVQPGPPAVFDGHSDFAIHYLRAEPPWSATAHDIEASLPGQADVPRWRRGNVIGMLATVASDQPLGSEAHFQRLLRSLDWLDALAARHSGSLCKVGSTQELRSARGSGCIALVPAIEGGEQLDYRLPNLRLAYERGVRSMGLVYDHHNRFGDGAMVQQGSAAIARASNGGLSALGRSWIAEMNRLGMMVDLSHADERTALNGIAASKAPVIFSHGGVRALSDTPRNLSDDVLRAIRSNGGIVMVSFVPYLATHAYWRWFDSGEREYARLVATHTSNSARVEEGMADWDRSNPQPLVTMRDVADQIEHVARIAGHDHVGIGSDFDGMGRFIVPELADAARVPALFAELRRRGWSIGQLEALANGNFLRVWAAVEKQASR